MRRAIYSIIVMILFALIWSCSQESPVVPEIEKSAETTATAAKRLDSDEGVHFHENEPKPSGHKIQGGGWHSPSITIVGPSNGNHYSYSSLPVSFGSLTLVEGMHNGPEVWMYLNGQQIYHNEFPDNWAGALIYPNLNLTYYGSYQFKVKATNSFLFGAIKKTSTKTNTFYVDDPNPPAPPAPSISSSTSNCNPKISWSSVSGATGYKIYRSNSSGGSYSQISTTSSTQYTDNSQEIWVCESTGPKYYVYYKVKAYNSSGESPYSNIKSFTVSEPLF